MGKFLDVSAQDSTPVGVFIGDSGTKLFLVGDQFNRVYRYTLGTPGDVSTGTFDTGQQINLSQGTPADIWLNNTGTKLYAAGNNPVNIEQWTLATPWDLTTATQDGVYDPSAQVTSPRSAVFDPTGAKMYVTGVNIDTIFEYDLTTAHDITGVVTYTGNSKGINPPEDFPLGMSIDDGTNDHIFVASFDAIRRWTMATPLNISTAALDAGQIFNYTEGGASTNAGCFVSPNGASLYTANNTTDTVYQYDMAPPWDLTTAVFNPPITADGAVTRTVITTGTAVTNHHRAAGAVTRTLNIAATGDNATLQANGGVTMALSASSTARGTIHASAALIVNKSVASTTSAASSKSGAVTIPITMSAFMQQEGVNDIVLPALQISANALTGTATTADVFMPALTVEAYGANDAVMTIPALSAQGDILSDANMSADVRLPTLKATGGFDNARALSADLTLPRLRNNGSLVAGAVTDTDMHLPRLRAYGVMSAGQTASGDMILPALESNGVIVSESVISAALTLPALYMTGFMEPVVARTFSAWALNTENLLTSEYTNYPYLDVAHVFGRYLGVAADGVYELTGADDNTVNIDADVLFGFDSFGTEDLKRVKAVHMGYRADNAGDLQVQIVVDGEDKVRTYPIKHVSSTNGIKRGRATVAKGLKSRYWQYGFVNVDGADFIADDLNIYVEQHNRKAQ